MTHLDHVGLNVQDLDRMRSFYARAFGYAEQARFSVEAVDLAIVMLVDEDGRRFELLSRGHGAPGLRAATPDEAVATWGFGHVAFRVDDLAAACRRSIDLGASPVFPPRPSPEDGVWFAYLHDPEGNLVELIGPVPA